jgi:hypothetical protein
MVTRIGVSAFVCCTSISAVPALAQSAHTTRIALARPVQVPGEVLSAGTYELQALPSSVDAILIRDSAHHSQYYVRVVRTTRVDRGATFAFNPVSKGSVAQLASWYPDGGTMGYMFAYGKANSVVSTQQLLALDDRVELANRTVGDAKSRLLAAEHERRAIKAERAGHK